jgi:uncharacterized protein (TIGR02452 family)
MPTFRLLPCLDSEDLATSRRRDLQLSRERAIALGLTAVEAVREGYYLTEAGARVVIREAVQAAVAARVSLPPEAALPARRNPPFPETVVSVANETTLGASRRLVEQGLRPVALNFANGVSPGGGFLKGALAQEEVLCRSSALFATLDGDPMYEAHQRRADRESSDWAILSPRVPVFRMDDGTALAEPWLLSILTCAAPVATAVGQPRAGDLLAVRIGRVLEIAAAFGYESLVLGAWGCGAFGNDTARTACDFRAALEDRFLGVFSRVGFAITDWSPERRFLGPFRDAFAAPSEG